MFGVKNICAWGGICAAALMLNACASVMFPDFPEDEDDVVVAEGGRVERELPKEGNSLKADKENIAYEDGEEAEEITAAKTTPVVSEEIAVEEPVEKVSEVAELEEVQPVVNETTVVAEEEQPTGPSVSYRVETILFANGSAVVDSSYNRALRDVVKKAKENDATVIVYGYASSRTRNTDPATHKLVNFQVSLERAQNVAAALNRAGLSKDRIIVEALSDTTPAYLEVMPEGERLNRRAELYLSF